MDRLIDRIRLKIALLLFPEPKFKELTKQQFQKLIGEVKNSQEAADLFARYMEMFEIPIIEDKRISMNTWNFHVTTVPKHTYIITFKRGFLYNFDKIFNLKTNEHGTGLNSNILKYALRYNCEEALIVRPNREIYSLNINKLLEYTDEFHTIREEKGEYEFHCPLSFLKKILTITEYDEIDRQIQEVYPKAKI